MAIIIPWSGGADSTALLMKVLHIESHKPNPTEIICISVNCSAINSLKRKKEKESRMKLRERIKDNQKNRSSSEFRVHPLQMVRFREVGISSDFMSGEYSTFDVRVERSNRNLATNSQTPLWAYVCGSVVLPNDVVLFAYHADDGCHSETEAVTSIIKTIASMSYSRGDNTDEIYKHYLPIEVTVDFPFINTPKWKLVEYLSSIRLSDNSTMLEHIWYCEDPKTINVVPSKHDKKKSNKNLAVKPTVETTESKLEQEIIPCGICAPCKIMKRAMWELEEHNKEKEKE